MRVIYQNEVAECGYACLAMALSHLGRATETREISAYRPISANGLSMMDLHDVALEFGLSVQAYQFGASDLAEIKPGSILHFGGSHYVVFEKCTRSYVRLLDPAAGRRRVSMDMFLKNVSGYLLEFAPTPELPQIRARSRIPAALARVRMLCPQLHRQIGKVMFVALAGQFAILAMPYFGRLVLDYVVSSDNENLLNVLTLTFAGIFLVGAFSQYAQTYLVELIYGMVCVNMREGLVGHLMRNPIAFFEKRNVGDLFARVKSQDEISTHAVKTTVATGVDLTVAVLALILMLSQSPRLTAVALAIFGFYVLVAVALLFRMLDARILLMQESARCDNMLIETIRAAPQIKLASGEIRRVCAYMTIFKGYVATLVRDSKLLATRDAVLKLTTYADLIAVTWLAAGLMLKGSISVGVFYSFMIYKSLATDRLARSVNALIAYFMLEVPATRVEDIVECEEERYTPMAERQKAVEVKAFEKIEMRNLSFRYGVSDQPVLNHASLDIYRGDKIVIVGPSGSGKTTLLKLLGAAEPLQQGEILLNGIAWPNLTVDEIRRHAAQMRQGDILLNGSISENVSLFSAHEADDARVNQMLEDVGLLADVMRMPMRTRTVISETIANISAGQRQRLLLARALYQNRELLLLDEPTSNLDAASVSHISNLLQGLDRTMVVITHDMALASAFERRYRLVDGTLMPDGLLCDAA
ncbi:peptidase domain-containing ABC transporter [Rhodanobacter sp. MP7CTX1]|uniref:peptidase domain-containing ABC transporter n=1 Tax=Rhodanobacter sp. MP7CTX1 TaxID=2723084 RepID=UPI001610F27A|nr:peptidase domain-containing ABC transporter [Rhodanobacter sp. MP7CTX1]MBB6189507.1 ATP-binding cassette subfamily B protein RaxB [Rhodanobacter sp. MP7CTX1]